MFTMPSSRDSSSARASRWEDRVPTSSTSPPKDLTPANFTGLALVGMTMTERTPSRWAAQATPWAWLPEEAHTRPWERCWGVRARALFMAPRILNAPMTWNPSNFR